MECPNCKSANTAVKDSRKRPEDGCVFRRRKCKECHHTFSTYENYTMPKTDTEVSNMLELQEILTRQQVQDRVIKLLFG